MTSHPSWLPADPPLVSVVVATNRESPFLGAALDSVVNQTYTHWELIVVDDGSPDPGGLGTALAAYPAARLIRQDNAGPSVARNVGAAASSGEFLVFLDDDDMWDPERLARQVQSLLTSAGAPLSYCKMHSIDEAGKTIFPATQIAVGTRRDVLRGEAGILLPNVMVRRHSFERIGGFHPALRHAEDLDLILRLAAEGTFAFVDEDLVAYRAHGGNLTGQWAQLVRSIDRVLDLHAGAAAERGDREAVADHKVRRNANHRYAAWSAVRSARGLLRQHRYGAAVGELATAARLAPDAPFLWLRKRL